MRTPVGVSLADYVAAVKADAPSHVRLTFLAQNVVLTDEDIEASGGLRLNNFLNGDTDLVMGKAVMSSIEVSIFNTSKVDGLIWSSECKLEFGLEVGGATRWNTIGYFTGSRPEKIHSVEVISFTANDRMNRFDRLADDWVNSLTYPMTVNEMFHSLCSWCNVSYESGDELANMLSRSYSSSPFVLEGMTCREILACIAEACGCYARVNSAGNCQMTWFSDHTSDYTVNENDEFPPVEIFDFTEGKKWKDLEDFKWKDLESLTWADLGGTKSLFEVNALSVVSSFYETNVVVPSATNGNIYTIVDNPFLTFASAAEKTAYIVPIYNRLYAFGGYIPLKVNCLGNALVEAGDVINVVVDGTTIVLPIFCKTVMFNGALTDSYETTGQIIRDEVTPEVKAKIAEGAKYSLVMEEIELTARNKYDIQSGIAIKPEGVEIDASKYIKMKSGSDIDIESGADVNVKSGGKIDVKTGGDIDIESGADVNVKAGGKLNVKFGGDIEVASGGDINVKSGGNLNVASGGNVDINASGNLRLTGSTVEIKSGSTFTVDSTNFKLDSINRTLQTGDWHLDFTGLFYNEICPVPDREMKYLISSYDLSQHHADYFLTQLVIDNFWDAYFGETNWNLTGRTGFVCYNPVTGNRAGFPVILQPEYGQVLVGDNSRWGNYGYSTTYYGDKILVPYSDRTTQVGTSVIPFTYGFFDSITYTSLIQNSSKDIKHNIQPLPSIGDRLDTLKPVTFVYDKDKNEKQRMGLIYEDTVETMPEICTNDESDKAINYVELIPALLKEIQDLRARVKALEEREEH